MSIHVSATSIKDYLVCPRRVYYRINFPDSAIPTPDMTAGNIVHEAIEKYWKSRDRAFEYSVMSVNNGDITLTLADKIFTAVNNFFQIDLSGILTDNDLIEHRFKIPLSNNNFLVGKIDRITEGGLILDWKTTTRPQKSIDRDPQFLTYYWAYKTMFKKPPVSVLYVSLMDKTIVTMKYDSVSYNQLIKEIVPSMLHKIKNNDLPATGLFNGSCYRCNFATECFKNLSEEESSINVVENRDVDNQQA